MQYRNRVLLLLVLACMIIGGGLGSVAAAHHGRARPRHQTRHRRPWVKPQIVGLVDKGSQAAYVLRVPFPTADPAEVAPFAGAFAGIVVNETWAQLQPGVNRFTFAALRRSLVAVAAYNRTHPRHRLAVKLRVFGGFTAPNWAKTLGGTAPVSFATAHAGGTTGRWWTAAYRAAWSTFQHRLAKDFDGDRSIDSVAVSSCATLTAEPFVQSPNPTLHAELFADGWTSAAQKRCLKGAFADYAGWVHTPMDYAFNPFVDYAPSARAGMKDLTFTHATMKRCATLLRQTGRVCILSNHAFTADVTASRSAPIYSEMAALHRADPRATPIDLQTGPPDNFGGCLAIDLALADHAQSLELWPPSANPHGFRGFAAYSSAELVRWAGVFRTRHPLVCP